MSVPSSMPLAGHFHLEDFDKEEVMKRRGDHNRLGFAYQIAFVRLTGRFPAQKPFELIKDLVLVVAAEFAIDPDTITIYARRRETVSEHQEQLREYLGLRRFGEDERCRVEQILFEEAGRLEQGAALLAKARQLLQEERILVPAESTLLRMIGEQRDRARRAVFDRIMEMLNPDIQDRLDALLIITDAKITEFNRLKAPPGFSSPAALVELTDKLDRLWATGVLYLDLAWLNNNFQKALARRAKSYDAFRLRDLAPAYRYALMVCFLWQTYRETIDQIIQMYDKIITKTYRRAQDALDDEMARQRKTIRDSLAMLRTLGEILLDETVADGEVRTALFSRIPRDRFSEEMGQVDQWLTGKNSDVFALVMMRFSYLRQFAPSLLDHIAFELESTGDRSILEAVEILRRMNVQGKRKVPEDAPVEFISPRMRRFVCRDGEIDRKAYECAVLTAVRHEIRRGNLWIPGSQHFCRLDDFFIEESEWDSMREAFFRRSGLPRSPAHVGSYLAQRLSVAYDRFLTTLPCNAYVRVDKDGWRLSSDPGDAIDPDDKQRLEGLEAWLNSNMRSIKLPNLLIEVDNELRFTRHFIASMRETMDRVQEVCTILATIMAYGCNIGPWTMAQLTNQVSYKEMKRIAEWHLHEETLKPALADVVNAITDLDTTSVWGEGKTSSSDGQRFLFPKKVLQRTYSPRFGDFALEFYSFVADNYAPFYSVPIECTARDAPYVLDGLLYHETDLQIEEHYVDTHGYTELNFAAFSLFGKRLCPRIRGLHHQWIYRIDRDKDYGALAPVVGRGDRTIHLDWICAQWDRMAQFFASFESGHTTASVALKRLVSYGPKNTFYRAVRELGRVVKTEFILDYLSNPALRKRTRRGLLKGEQLHALARIVHYGKRGISQAKDFEEQMNTASCLNLILACIVYWQAREISRILAEHDPESKGIDTSTLSHISPIGWDNVLLYGDYILDRGLVKRP